MNKHLSIGILSVTAIIFGAMWVSQSKEREGIKFYAAAPQRFDSAQHPNTEDDNPDAAFEQMDTDLRDATAWEKLRCTPTARLMCHGTQCTPSEPAVYLILDRQNNSFSRCDAKGCDSHKAQFGTSGMFTNIQGAIPIGTMIKVQGNRAYIEIATLGLSSSFSSGTCTVIP
jgi:hypothetical protein